jgi:hypothetical protein
MAEKSPARIPITKLNAAKREIEIAIWLWFHNFDPVAIHILTSAAHRILHDLLVHAGTSSTFFDNKYLPKGFEKETKRLFRKYETFFKHAKDDPNDTLDFNPNSTQPYLYDAVESYLKLRHSETELMTAYRLRYRLTFPDYWKQAEPIPEKSLPVEFLSACNRREFFEYFFGRPVTAST